MPTMTPPEVLNAIRQQVKQELELETMKSSLLYQRQYQKFLKGAEPEPVKEGETERIASPTSDYTDAVKRAYSEAYALRAFRDVMKDVDDVNIKKEIQPQAANSIATTLMQSGASPEAINKWLTSLSPEALGALIALQSGNPMLAQMSFAMGQRGKDGGLTLNDVLTLSQALAKSSNIDIVKLLEVVSKQPQGVTTKEMLELINMGVTLATRNQPQQIQQEEKKPTGILENLLQTPEGAKLAKEMGLIGNDTATLTVIAEMRKNDQSFQKMMKDSDRNWELRLEELKAKREVAFAKIEEGRERTKLIGSSLQRVGSAIAEGILKGGEAEGTPDIMQATPNQPQRFECEVCHSPIIVPANAIPGQQVECPKCHEKYETTPLGKQG